MKQHRRSSSPVHLSAEQSLPLPPSRTGALAMEELRSKADELERLLAATNTKVGTPARRTSSPRVRRGGSESPDHTGEVLDEMPLRLRPSDDDLLLNMVHDLQHNMRQSILGSARGRLYERYTQRRDGKLREEQGSAEWVRKKEEMKTMEDFLEETWTLLKARSGDSSAGNDSFLQYPLCLRKQPCEEDHDEHAPCVYKPLGGTTVDESGKGYGSGKLLSRKKCVYSSTSQNSRTLIPRSSKATCSGIRKQQIRPENSLRQMAGESSDLREENRKPLDKVRKLADHSDTRTFNRSRSSHAGSDVSKEEKQPKFRHMRNRSVAFRELEELEQVNFNSSSLELSQSLKDHREDAVSRKQQVRGEHKPFPRRGGGISPVSGASISEPGVLKAHDSTGKRDDDEDLMDKQEYSQDMIGNIEVFERRRSKRRDSLSPAKVNNEKRPSQESGRSDDIKCVAKNNFHAGLMSNIHSSFSSANETSDIDTSVQSLRYSPSTINTQHVNPIQEADVIPVRKKWGSIEKPNFAMNDLDRSLKDATKAFKKLLRLGSKSKNADRKMNYTSPTSTSSGGGDDAEDDAYQVKQPGKLHSNIALHEGSIFPNQGPLISFRSFNG